MNKEQDECDHLIGEWDGVYENGNVLLSQYDTYKANMLIDDYFNFCPKCGKPIPEILKSLTIEQENKQ